MVQFRTDLSSCRLLMTILYRIWRSYPKRWNRTSLSGISLLPTKRRVCLRDNLWKVRSARCPSKVALGSHHSSTCHLYQSLINKMWILLIRYPRNTLRSINRSWSYKSRQVPTSQELRRVTLLFESTKTRELKCRWCKIQAHMLFVDSITISEIDPRPISHLQITPRICKQTSRPHRISLKPTRKPNCHNN